MRLPFHGGGRIRSRQAISAGRLAHLARPALAASGRRHWGPGPHARLAEEIHTAIAEAVKGLRGCGCSWAEIGSRLGGRSPGWDEDQGGVEVPTV